jgi:DegV family protein with EDD domain
VTVAIVTDSAAALPAELVARHAVTVVPMRLTVDGESVRDNERDLDAFLAAGDVSTSGPNPAEFEGAIRSRLTGDGVIVLTIAGSMSSTYQAAVAAARAVGDDVRVVDTLTAAGAEALVVLAAARAASSGATIDDVELAAKQVIEQVHLVATVPSLDHLVRSGRVPNVAGWAGRRLGISPLFEFRDGRARPLRPALSFDAALDRIVGLFRRSAVAGAQAHVVALHAAAPEAAARLLEQVEAQATPVNAFVGTFGPVMVVHTGPGLVGLAWWWEEDAPATA